MTSRLVIRLGAVALAIAIVWYISHLHSQIAQLQERHAKEGPPAAAERAPAAAARERAPAVAAGKARTLTPEQRDAMIERLGGRGSSQTYPVWFATVPNDSEAAAFQRALQSAFEEAGWQVHGNAPVRFAMKAGVYIFAADEEPPEYVSTVQEALEAAGITIAGAGRGYREFAKQKKEENPAWVGLELAPDETYIIAIGRRPAEEPPS